MPPTAATIPAVTHHTAAIDGTDLHHVTAGTTGSTILLVHGFPETWWTFHRLIPLLAAAHRVVAVDLRGFGDSSTADDDHSSATAADDLHALIQHLGRGPVHVLGQDISGATVLRLARCRGPWMSGPRSGTGLACPVQAGDRATRWHTSGCLRSPGRERRGARRRSR